MTSIDGPPADDWPDEIGCVECGGRCVRVTRYEPGWGPEPGDILVYRCTVCLHRFDVEVGEGEEDDSGPHDLR